jgi:uncharacterized LabA/DUF88 family protein
MTTDTTIKLALLIDSDNAQPGIAGPLLAEVAKYGTAFVRRAYGDWTSMNLKGWKEHLLELSIQPVQQFAYTQGKNATDSAMIIDAMDLLYTNRFNGFCIVSSDSDFTRLAARIRESGLLVYGFGERKTPKPFVSACDKFIYFENIAGGEQLTTLHASSSAVLELKLKESISKLLVHVVNDASDDAGWANLANVGVIITKQFPDFDPRTFGYLKLSDLVVATGLFEIERRTPREGKAVVVYARVQQNAKKSTERLY